jgi:hypothetical protein
MFQVPTSTSERFEFQIGDDTYTVPLVKHLSVDLSTEIAEVGGTAGLLLAFTDGAREAVGRLDSEQFEALTTAWFEASGITLGESEASESS